jgi:hypothetical protein
MIKSTNLGPHVDERRKVPMAETMTPLTEERKQEIISEHPDGLWLVLDEEYPRHNLTPGDLLCGDPVAGGILPEGA